jgi:hypothetical protein
VIFMTLFILGLFGPIASHGCFLKVEGCQKLIIREKHFYACYKIPLWLSCSLALSGSESLSIFIQCRGGLSNKFACWVIFSHTLFFFLESHYQPLIMTVPGFLGRKPDDSPAFFKAV